MSYEHILTERRGEGGGVLWLTLNRPAKLNALTMPMLAEMLDVFQQLRRDRSVRCLVITGSGRGFCAGMDFSGSGTTASAPDGPGDEERRTPPPAIDLEGQRLYFRNESEAFVALRRIDVPVLASVNGPCVGAGLDLVAHCDLAVGSTAARYQVAYVKRGYFADLGGFWSLPRILGWRKAMELMMTGRFMSAEEAHESGLTNYLVAPEELESKTMELAQMIESGPPVAQKLGKLLAYRTGHLDFDSALEMSGVALSVIHPSEDRIEGARSFLEKREPRFTGR